MPLMAKKKDDDRKIVADNRKAPYAYAIESTLETGLQLMGSEVKSLRSGKANIVESSARRRDGETLLVKAYTPEYTRPNRFNHEPRRPRKLLVHRGEAKR